MKNDLPIRVLHVFKIMNRGGAESLVMNLYQNIDREKVQFDFVVHDNTPGFYDKMIRELGGRIYYVPTYKVINHMKYKKAWRKVLSTSKPNILHAHLRGSASVYIKIAKKYQIKTIMHSHSVSSRGNVITRIIKEILQVPLRWLPNYYFACSAEAAVWLFGKRVLSSKSYHYIPNAISIDEYIFDDTIRTSLRKKIGIKSTDIVLGHVGNFMREKNHKFLLEVLEQLPDNYYLVLIGNGPLLHDMQVEAVNKKIDKRVIFLGSVDNVNELLNVFDVFLFPSLFEGLGMAAVEAQANGLNTLVSQAIPAEAIILDQTLQLPLYTDTWINEILELTPHRDVYSLQKVKKSGYDIKNLSVQLCDMYSKINKGEDYE